MSKATIILTVQLDEAAYAESVGTFPDGDHDPYTVTDADLLEEVIDYISGWRIGDGVAVSGELRVE